MYRTIAVAAVLLTVGSAAHAAGALPGKLKAGLKNTVPALTAAKLPALQSGLKAPKLAGLSGGSTAAALPSLPGLDTYWLDYNLTTYPVQLRTWAQDRQMYATYGLGNLQDRIGAGASGNCPDNACAPGANPQIVGAADYVADILDIGNGAAGLVIKGPPPKPLLPSELSGQIWLDYNLNVWSTNIVNYTYDEYVGRTLMDTSALIREIGNLSLTNLQPSTGNILTAAGNSAAGLVIKGPPPKPLLPGEALP